MKLYIWLQITHTCSTFMENYSPNGIVAVSYATLQFTGINYFFNNTGRAVQVRLSLVIKTDNVATGIIHR